MNGMEIKNEPKNNNRCPSLYIDLKINIFCMAEREKKTILSHIQVVVQNLEQEMLSRVASTPVHVHHYMSSHKATERRAIEWLDQFEVFVLSIRLATRPNQCSQYRGMLSTAFVSRVLSPGRRRGCAIEDRNYFMTLCIRCSARNLHYSYL